MNEYSSLLKEIVMAFKQSTEENCGSQFKFQSFITQEPVVLSSDCVLNMEGLELVSVMECSLLQINITKV